jgi:anti-sigma B factor antagonist
MELQTRTIAEIKILEIKGRFDTLSAPGVQTWLEDATRYRPAQVVVNLAGVDFVDSTALATLVSGMKRSRQVDGDLRLCGLRAPVRMIFELTRLDQAFEIFTLEEEAIAAFTQ